MRGILIAMPVQRATLNYNVCPAPWEAFWFYACTKSYIESNVCPKPWEAFWLLCLYTKSEVLGWGVLRYPVPKWLFFLNICGEWCFTTCIVFFLLSKVQIAVPKQRALHFFSILRTRSKASLPPVLPPLMFEKKRGTGLQKKEKHKSSCVWWMTFPPQMWLITLWVGTTDALT